MSNLTVAKTILEQLGGNKFCMMTGAKNLAGDENSLSMRIGRNSSNSNYLKITLNSMDLYDMKFCKLTRKFEEKSVTEYSDVYNDMLTEVFEKHTGMYTKLF
jgi:transcription elongation factor Elf1